MARNGLINIHIYKFRDDRFIVLFERGNGLLKNKSEDEISGKMILREKFLGDKLYKVTCRCGMKTFDIQLKKIFNEGKNSSKINGVNQKIIK